jgi:hypothetical protein
MKFSGTRMMRAGLGLAAAYAAICCSAPLLMLVLPGLALLVGSATDAVEVGLLAALVVGLLMGAGVLVSRRRRGGCSRGSACGCGCQAATPLRLIEE